MKRNPWYPWAYRNGYPWTVSEEQRLLRLVEKEKPKPLDGAWFRIAKKLQRTPLAVQNRYFLVRSFERRSRS